MRDRLFNLLRAASTPLAVVMAAGILPLATTAPAASADLDDGGSRTAIYVPAPDYGPTAPPVYQAPGYPPPAARAPYDEGYEAPPPAPYGSYPDQGGDRYQYGYRSGPYADDGYGVPYDGDPAAYGDGPPRPPAVIAQPRVWNGYPDPAWSPPPPRW